MRLLQTSLALATLCATASPAGAGWHARTIERAVGKDAPKESHASDIYFQSGKMRIDQGGLTSMIYDFSGGHMTMMSHRDKAYVSQSLADMKAMRLKMEAEASKQMASLPADARAELEAKMKKMEAARSDAEKPKPTGETTKVGGKLCAVYRWKAEGNEGEMCLAKDPGVDLAEFIKATEVFSKKLSDATGGKSGQGDALLEMAKVGFPVRTRRKLSFNGRQLEVLSELESMKVMNVPADRFAVPKEYTKQQMPTRGPPPPAAPKR